MDITHNANINRNILLFIFSLLLITVLWTCGSEPNMLQDIQSVYLWNFWVLMCYSWGVFLSAGNQFYPVRNDSQHVVNDHCSLYHHFRWTCGKIPADMMQIQIIQCTSLDSTATGFWSNSVSASELSINFKPAWKKQQPIFWATFFFDPIIFFL